MLNVTTFSNEIYIRALEHPLPDTTDTQSAYLASFIFLNQGLVDTQRARPGWEAQHERVLWRRTEMFDTLHDVFGNVEAGRVGIVTNDESHGERTNVAKRDKGAKESETERSGQDVWLLLRPDVT
jgi:hypothetical protein